MARPAKNNAEYFPHLNGMRNHRKVKMLRNKFGNVMGYAFWSLMLEWLTEHDGLEWEYSEIEIEMFSSELGVSAAEIPPLIDYCLKIGLLSKTDSDFIYSDSLNENLKCVFDKRFRERQKSKDRKRKEDGTFIPENTTTHGVSATETIVSAADCPHSKVKESIVEESIVNIKDVVVGNELPTDTKNLALEKREKAFMESCAEYVNKPGNPKGKYSKDLIRSFFDYWKERNKSNTKMRFEMGKTWELHLRLATWSHKEPIIKNLNVNQDDQVHRQQKML